MKKKKIETEPGEEMKAAAPPAKRKGKRSGQDAPRRLDDHSAQELATDSAGEAAEINAKIQAEEKGRESAEGEWTAEDEARQVKLEVERFKGWARAVFMSLRTTMKTLRDRMGVDDQWTEEVREFRCKSLPAIDPMTGEIDKTDPEAHKEAGLSLGLFADACTTIPPIITPAILGNSGYPYVLNAKGKKAENKGKTKLCTSLVDDQLDAARWRDEMQAAINDLPYHGTSVLRQSWIEESEMIQIAPGVWKERIARRGIEIRNLPLIKVWVSHPGRRRAQDQATVLFHQRATLGELLRHERVVEEEEEIETGEGGAEMELDEGREVSGRLVGLERFQRVKGEQASDTFQTTEQKGSAQGTVTGLGAETQTGEDIMATPDLAIDCWDMQGDFPIGAGIRLGYVTPRVREYFRMNLEVPGKAGKKTRKVEGEELARLADKMKWYITLAETATTGDEGEIIECRPCPYRTPRTELLKGTGFRKDGGFYGLSAHEHGKDLSRAADEVFNRVYAILSNNAGPGIGYDPQRFPEPGDEEKLAAPMDNEMIPINGGSSGNISDAIHYFVKPWQPDYLTLMKYVIETYSGRVAVYQSQKGGQATTESKTAAAQLAQAENASARWAWVAKAFNSEVIKTSIEWALEDIGWFMTGEELREEATRVAGELGLDAELILPTAAEEGTTIPGNLADDFIVSHPGSSTIAPEVAVQFMMQLLGILAAAPDFKLKEYAKQMADTMGLNGDDWFEEKGEAMTPKNEMRMILGGDNPRPVEGQDHIAHLELHAIQKTFLAEARAWLIENKKDIRFVSQMVAVLDAHIEGHMNLMEKEAAAQAAVAAAQGPQMMGPPMGPPMGGPGMMGAPPREAEIMSGLAAAAGGGLR